MNRRRSSFTLIEILVVITILVTITVFVVMAIKPNPSSTMREAGRIGQATILGARDRALHANDRRGFRLFLDPNNSNAAAGPVLATGFVYVQPIPIQTYPTQGTFTLERNLPATDVTIVRPAVAVDWYSLSEFFSSPPKIRIPATTGQWYTFSYSTAAGPNQFTQASPVLQLTSAFADGAPHSGDAFTCCDIEIRNELLPNHQPLYLPSGVVIDLTLSRPATNATVFFPDIMFSPRGTVVPSGINAAISPVYLFLRDVRDALNRLDPSSQQLQGDQLILTIFPQTGHVQAYPVDTTDLNPVDNIADDPYRYAKLGQKAAG